MHSIPSPILYHYTSGTSLLGIFENGSLWATRIHYMNDSKEFSHAIELATSTLLALKARRPDRKYQELCSAVLNHLETISKLALYVACFSEVEDSLSQWRGYCPPRFGYSLGFDGEKLRQIALAQGFELRPCIYDRQKQLEIVNNWALTTLEALLSNCPDDTDPTQFTFDNCNTFLHQFIGFAPYMKDNSFKDELEWRLVGLIPSNDSRVGLRHGLSMLIPYVPIKLNLSTDDSPIWNICIGPTPHIELATNSVTLLFQKAKVRNGIHYTRIPYRDW